MSDLTRTGEAPVDYETARSRVACAMAGKTGYWLQSNLADMIWPNHRMKRQGAALAAGRYSRRLLADGVIANSWDGYVIGPRAATWSGAQPKRSEISADVTR